jgi:hypothetical protein
MSIIRIPDVSAVLTLGATEIADKGSPTRWQAERDHSSRPWVGVRLVVEETNENRPQPEQKVAPSSRQTPCTSPIRSQSLQVNDVMMTLPPISEVLEEEILYPRISRETASHPLPPISELSPKAEELIVERDLPSSTESSDVYLSNASNKPLRTTSRMRISDSKHITPLRDHSKGEAFRMYRPVRGEVPSSDPESFFSGTRTVTWQAKREGRLPQRVASLAWTSAGSLRPKSPPIRPASVTASRIADQGILQRYSGNKSHLPVRDHSCILLQLTSNFVSYSLPPGRLHAAITKTLYQGRVQSHSTLPDKS